MSYIRGVEGDRAFKGFSELLQEYNIRVFPNRQPQKDRLH